MAIGEISQSSNFKEAIIMKRLVLLSAIAGLLFVSCNKIDSPKSDEPVTISATVETAQTKADLNGSYQTIWDDSDEIIVYFSEWDDNRYQTFKCNNEVPSSTATFEWVNPGGWYMRWDQAKYAFYPKSSSEKQKIGDDGNFYYELPTDYYGYESGKSYIPLVANLGNVDNPTIKFKYVGGAVKISLADIPASANKVQFSMGGNFLTGFHHVASTNIGGVNPGGLSPNEGVIKDTLITLNFEKGTSTRSMDFIFPVPPVTVPKPVTVKLFTGTTQIWSVTSKKNQGPIERAQILVMPELTVPTTKTITVGIVNYLTDALTPANFKLHIWSEGASYTNDLLLTTLGKQESVKVPYAWGDAQTFNMYKAEVPIDIDGFQVWYDGDTDRWFGNDGLGGTGTSLHTNVYVYNYGGDRAYYQ